MPVRQKFFLKTFETNESKRVRINNNNNEYFFFRIEKFHHHHYNKTRLKKEGKKERRYQILRFHILGTVETIIPGI